MTAKLGRTETRRSPAGNKIHLIQGEYRVSDSPDVVFTTTLGSCVATCMRDAEAGVGGMNHFLLPHGGVAGADMQRFGAHAMELLINALLSSGARRDRLEAKLFGGARLDDGLPDIGRQNAEFAKFFLANEGIAYDGGSLGGRHARRLQFWPACGRVRQLVLRHHDDAIFAAERRKRPIDADCGSVELFAFKD
ncbi:MAG: chemotaxis protein CheD [Proteobacteria bacterium]|nr:chemotaxis protein CheD [Pseudomonadota bacterium]